MKCERDLSKKKNIKTMNGEMTTNSQLSTTKPQNKNKLSRQLKQEENQRNGDHMEGYQWGGVGENGGKGMDRE